MASALIQWVIRTQSGWIKGSDGGLAAASMLVMATHGPLTPQNLLENHRARKIASPMSGVG
jgi:hypothetical protein